MSQSKSPFIEGSKHKAMTSAVEAHFATDKKRTMPGVAAGKGFADGGDSKWNNKSQEDVFLNNETGVNYKHNGAQGSYPRGKR